MRIDITDKRLKTVSRQIRQQLGLDESQGRALLDALAQGLGYRSHGALKTAIDAAAPAPDAGGLESQAKRLGDESFGLETAMTGRVPRAEAALTAHDIACYLAVGDSEDGEPDALHVARAEAWLGERRNRTQVQRALDRQIDRLAEDCAETVPEIELFQVCFSQGGHCAHDQVRMPWDLKTFTLLAGAAFETVKAWVDTRDDLVMREMEPDEVEDPEILTLSCELPEIPVAGD